MATTIPENSPVLSLNLEPYIVKLCHPTKGQNWDVQRAQTAVLQYRRWLWLHTQYEDVQLSPSKDVDQVWHMHILDTRKYAQDCFAIFNGKFLHHNGFAGWESDKAEEVHQASYQDTKALYAENFGEEFIGETGMCESGYCDSSVKQTAEVWRPTMEYLKSVA